MGKNSLGPKSYHDSSSQPASADLDIGFFDAPENQVGSILVSLERRVTAWLRENQWIGGKTCRKNHRSSHFNMGFSGKSSLNQSNKLNIAHVVVLRIQ